MPLELIGVETKASEQEDVPALREALRPRAIRAREHVLELLASSLPGGDPEWKQTKKGSGVTLVSRAPPADCAHDAKFHVATGLVRAPPLFVFSMVASLEQRLRWDENIHEKSGVLRALGDDTDVIYSYTPPIASVISAREFVDCRHWAPTPEGGIAAGSFSVERSEELAPASKSTVRGVNGTCGMVVQPVEAGADWPAEHAELFRPYHEEHSRRLGADAASPVPHSRFTIVYQTNPGGYIPKFVLDRTVASITHQTLVSVIKACDKVAETGQHLPPHPSRA